MARPLSFDKAVYQALDVKGSDDGVLFALHDALSLPAASSSDALNALVKTLCLGCRAGALGDVIAQRTSVENALGFQSDLERWPYGTPLDRSNLAFKLLGRARATSSEFSGDAQDCARAALLLAAQEGFRNCASLVRQVLAEPNYQNLARWPGPQLEAVKLLLESERAQFGAYIAPLGQAVRALRILIDTTASALDPAQVDAFMEGLEGIAKICGSQAEAQWRLANLAWRFANLARAMGEDHNLEMLKTSAERWSEEVADPNLERWLNEAVTYVTGRPTSTGLKVISVATLRRDAKPLKSLGSDSLGSPIV